MNPSPIKTREADQEKPPQRPLRPKLTPNQQLEALRRIQAQAESRVKLGVQLFKAAETYSTYQNDLLEQVRASLEHVQEQWHQDSVNQVQAYEKCIRQIDDRLVGMNQTLDDHLDKVRQLCSQTQQRVEVLVEQAQGCLGRCMTVAGSIRTEVERGLLAALANAKANTPASSPDHPACEDTTARQSPMTADPSTDQSDDDASPRQPVLSETGNTLSPESAPTPKPVEKFYTQVLQRMHEQDPPKPLDTRP